MELGMVGLGRMGGNMVRRLLRGGHTCVAYARSREAVDELAAEGAVPAHSLEELVEKLSPSRHVWLMIPSAAVGPTVEILTPLLDREDVVIDGGNSYYRDDVDRAERLGSRGIHWVDCGTSGGVWGLERGYCLMIGGEEAVVRRLDPIFETLAPGRGSIDRTPGREKAGGTAEEGYFHCGPHGAGHFVKMIHNGIEYGMMAAIAEGLNVLKHANVGLGDHEIDAETSPLRDPKYYRYAIDLAEVTELWRRGSVITSWLLDLTAQALLESPDLGQFSGRVSDSGEGRWTIQAAVEEGVPAHVLTASLYSRFDSRGNAEFQNKVLSAMRYGFGGHREKKEGR